LLIQGYGLQQGMGGVPGVVAGGAPGMAPMGGVGMAPMGAAPAMMGAPMGVPVGVPTGVPPQGQAPPPTLDPFGAL